MSHKKIIFCFAFLIAGLTFSAPVNEANRIIDIQQRQLEQERVRQLQEKMQDLHVRKATQVPILKVRL